MLFRTYFTWLLKQTTKKTRPHSLNRRLCLLFKFYSGNADNSAKSIAPQPETIY